MLVAFGSCELVRSCPIVVSITMQDGKPRLGLPRTHATRLCWAHSLSSPISQSQQRYPRAVLGKIATDTHAAAKETVPPWAVSALASSTTVAFSPTAWSACQGRRKKKDGMPACERSTTPAIASDPEPRLHYPSITWTLGRVCAFPLPVNG